jgi:hypothetical protein
MTTRHSSPSQRRRTLDRVVLDSPGRRGYGTQWLRSRRRRDSDPEKRRLSEELHRIVSEIEAGDLTSAIAWAEDNKAFLAAGPHPSTSRSACTAPCS